MPTPFFTTPAPTRTASDASDRIPPTTGTIPERVSFVAFRAAASVVPLMTPVMLNVIFAVVSGIMVYIAIDELLPSAEEYGMHHLSILGVIIGMAVMAVSLILL
jgi:zinc transporter ZupT